MIYIGCSTQVQLLGLTNSTNNTVVNNAVVVATLFDGDSNNIYSLTLSSTGSNGNYSGTIPAATTQTLIAGGTYTLNIISSVSSVQIDERNEKIQITFRGFNE